MRIVVMMPKFGGRELAASLSAATFWRRHSILVDRPIHVAADFGALTVTLIVTQARLMIAAKIVRINDIASTTARRVLPAAGVTLNASGGANTEVAIDRAQWPIDEFASGLMVVLMSAVPAGCIACRASMMARETKCLAAQESFLRPAR